MTRNGPPKILVVDDDARLRELLRRYLGDNGFAPRRYALTPESAAARSMLNCCALRIRWMF